jgi:ABC-type antimicrobial peptide transport system permease subunit
MKTRDLTDLALRNLREALLRNSLTTLGVAVGVASLVAMLSLGVGLQNLASSRLTRSGLFDAIFVTSQRDFRGGGPGRPNRSSSSNRASDSATTNSQSPSTPPKEPKPLDDDAISQFEKIPNVSEVYPQIRFASSVLVSSPVQEGLAPIAPPTSPAPPVREGLAPPAANAPTTDHPRANANPAIPTNVLGLPESSRRSGAFDSMTGKYFSSPTAEEAILQMDFAKDLSEQPATLVGKDLVLRYAERAPKRTQQEEDDALLDAITGAKPQTLSIVQREKTFRIVGITESDPSAGFGGFGGGRVFIPLKTALQLHVAQPTDLQAMMSGDFSKPSYISLTVRANSPKDVAAIETALKNLGYSAFSLLDAARNLRIVFAVFDLFLLLFSSLALTVASLGIINTLVMAVLERRREIGILKALGATDRDVKSLFFAEAGAMGFLGGIFGVLLGWLIGAALNLGTSIYLKRQDLPSAKIAFVPWWLVLASIAFAIIVSLVAGFYPASRAAKLNPVEALRYE